jgi:DNA replication and repair protein RecF
MAFLRLEVSQFRNLVSAKIEPVAQGINLFYGHNGSGKTSLLEAIYYLNLGRSFRNTKNDRIINNLAEKFSIFAQILTANGQKIPIGIEREQDGSVKIRIAGKDVRSIAELANLMPVLLITSHCHHFLDSSPVFRRKYLDWGAFYLSNDFLRVWRLYERSLKQRNAALRGQLPQKELEIWTNELINSAMQLDQFRQDYVSQLLPVLTQTVADLISIPGLEIKYLRGWNEQLNYAHSLAQSIDRDRQLGYTQMGPHRADFKVTIEGVPAKDILSRGQQKLFICAMILAQGSLLHCSTDKKPIYLIDDLPSELDLTSRSQLMALLSKQEAQVFVTAVEREILESFLIQPNARMFHVEHGDLTEMTLEGVETVE